MAVMSSDIGEIMAGPRCEARTWGVIEGSGAERPEKKGDIGDTERLRSGG